MTRGSWTGVIGVLGASVVMAWTAIETWLDSRAVFVATASLGLILVLAASVALAAVAVTSGVRLRRTRPASAGPLSFQRAMLVRRPRRDSAPARPGTSDLG